METMPPYTYKFVKNQGGNSSSSKKIGYLSKDVKVINDLIDDLSKLKTADNVATAAAAASASATTCTIAPPSGHIVSGQIRHTNDEMTNPLEIENDKESLQSISSSSSHTEPKAKLKEQVRK